MKLKLLMSLIVVGAMLSSCAIITPIPKMEKNYDKRMTTAEELAVKSHVKIFLNEKDVPCDYTVIALLKYKPLLIPPFIWERGKMIRKFYRKSVLKAAQIGGDAIIIQGLGLAKVITAPGLKTSITADDIPVADGNNPVDHAVSYVYEPFVNGTISSMSPKEKNKMANALQDEIEKDIESCKTKDDVAFISSKIDALENHLVAEGQKVKKVAALREDLNKAAAKITKRENRANKAAEGKQKIKDTLNGLRDKIDNRK